MTEAQTNANIPGPENVLVVYNINSSIEDSVMQYYVASRGIPYPDNVVELNLPDSTQITVDGVTHWVGIRQETDIIRDIYNHNIGTWYATEHAWKYFYNYIALPIKNHLINNNLTSTIRYIVLCKGVPFKVQAAADSSNVICNITLDGLLCMLNTNNYESLLHSIYSQYRSYAIPDTLYCNPCQMQITNPYYNVDPSFTMNYRFLPSQFTRNWNGYTIKLDYLVSHLDGLNYDIVKGMINKSVNADKSGTGTWIIDNDPSPWTFAHSYFTSTVNSLENYGFNVEYDYTNNWLTSYQGNIMGYSSYGTHAEDYNCNFQDSNWVKDSLDFYLFNGAIFNVLESFNGQSLTTLNW